MFEDYQICPYTGLRSFSEEESIYFKGREEHIDQAIVPLQRNKFLMLTGASGDGKSSLVYAGIVPNARAGFIKSRYTQWSVADFRPERSPFQNLCKALSKQLEIEQTTVASELKHGFSALVDLYKSSDRFVDVDSISWQQADEKERSVLKRKASNLMIIVDQFEEFFTNPENYQHGIPSGESNLVLNVLLETARIALEEDLPIYVVFTMRSDYIGQCAAFRSLPEYIGFSQFFVPRLNRALLQQAIEEPAELSGNKISRRLTERLIHDVSEGVDQLPTLQHALNRIWHAADQGKAEMDLIHYAMVGGMASSDLPDDQIQSFNHWFKTLSETVRSFYGSLGLQNVLNTHANKLLESAGDHYRKISGNQITDEAAKAIVKTAFVCLTKIDQNRAVRNRMTLKEITDIHGQPGIDEATVAGVLQLFREPGNTFIRPFITEDPESLLLSANQVMDITHESLIRNWTHLDEWAKEEFDHYNVFLDFEQQLNRWIASDKSNDFLLSIGQLAYFETWHRQVKPNTHWIARYFTDEDDHEKKRAKSVQLLDHMHEFLKRSASRHVVTRTFMRYGAGKIAASLAIVALLVLSSFVVNDYVRKRNDHVLQDIQKDILHLMNSPKANIFSIASMLNEGMQNGIIKISDVTANTSDVLPAIRLHGAMAGFIIGQGNCEPHAQLYRSLAVYDSLFNTVLNKGAFEKQQEKALKLLAVHQHDLELAALFKPSAEIIDFRKRNARMCAALVYEILTKQPTEFSDVDNLNRALELAISANAFTKDELQKITAILSPYENTKRAPWVTERYSRDILMKRGIFNYGYAYNGLYQELAYLYAAAGETPKALQCIDSLLLYKQAYSANDYTEMIDNASNVAAVFYTSGNAAMVHDFVKGYCTRKGMAMSEFYDRLLGRTTPSYFIASNTDPTLAQYSNGNLEYGSVDLVGFFSNMQRSALEEQKLSEDERNLRLALSFKNEGVLKAQKIKLRNQDSPEIFERYAKAVDYYAKVGQGFLKQRITIVGSNTVEQITVPYSYLFTFPDMRLEFHPLEKRNGNITYTSSSFASFLIRTKLFEKLYTTREDASAFQEWSSELCFFNLENPANQIKIPLSYPELKELGNAISANAAMKNVDLNVLYLYIGQEAFAHDQKQDFIKWSNELNSRKIFNSMSGSLPFKLWAENIAGLIHYDQRDSAYNLIKRFKNPVNRSSLYFFSAYTFITKGISAEKVSWLTDSAYAEMKRVNSLSGDNQNRILAAYTLALQDDKGRLKKAYQIIRNVEDKTFTIQFMCRALAFQNNLYEAVQNVPVDTSDDEQCLFLWRILYGYNHIHESPEWKKYNDSYPWYELTPIKYVNESF